MTPVEQTITGVGGNCLQACIASMFDLPLEEVPHIYRHIKPEDPGPFVWTKEEWAELSDWAKSRGLKAVWLDADIPEDADIIRKVKESGCLYIASGPSGVNPSLGHCVVQLNGENVHDPNPQKKFLSGEPDLYIVFGEHAIGGA